MIQIWVRDQRLRPRIVGAEQDFPDPGLELWTLDLLTSMWTCFWTTSAWTWMIFVYFSHFWIFLDLFSVFLCDSWCLSTTHPRVHLCPPRPIREQRQTWATFGIKWAVVSSPNLHRSGSDGGLTAVWSENPLTSSTSHTSGLGTTRTP